MKFNFEWEINWLRKKKKRARGKKGRRFESRAQKIGDLDKKTFTFWPKLTIIKKITWTKKPLLRSFLNKK